ncbi:MAG: hypothetical protein HY878_00865 [Deltaproteobacteria bacterium]|nr:hypothetical protein [Deltaproteobacteria bacterium]
MDLHMPGMNGEEVSGIIRGDDGIRFLDLKGEGKKTIEGFVKKIGSRV